MRYLFATIMLCLFSSSSFAFNTSHYGAGDGYYGKPVACPGYGLHKPGNTTAHRTLPCGTKVKITNRANGKSGIVVVTDRGPFVNGREWDLNSSFAREIGCDGLCNVDAEVLGKLNQIHLSVSGR